MTIPYLNLSPYNLEQEHICCAIGKGKHEAGALLKKEWMRQAFGQGLIFRKLDARGKVFVELMPVEHCLKPIIAPNYLVIHCLWVSGRYKGQAHGRQLIEFAIEEAKTLKKDGICVIAGKGNYLTDSKFYQHFGFEKADKTEDGKFELMALSLNDGDTPHFAAKAKKAILAGGKDFHVFTTNQCPFVPQCLNDFKAAASELSIKVSVTQLHNYQEVCNSPSPFGTFSVFYDEQFITHEMQSIKAYQKIFSKLGLL